jgi:hypothetical protein
MSTLHNSELARKLKIKAGQWVLLLNADGALRDELMQLPEITLDEKAAGTYEVSIAFCTTKQDFEKILPKLTRAYKAQSLLWIAFPKKSSGIQSDLGMYEGWEALSGSGFEGIAMISLNDTWSACRLRPSSEIKRTNISNKEIPTNDFGDYVNVVNKTIRIPEDLASALDQHPAAKAFFEALSYSHRKEYVIWILSARRAETRSDRVEKTVAKLQLNKKNPSDK